MRSDLMHKYEFFASKLYYAQELTAIPYAYLISWAYKRNLIPVLPTVGEYNNLSQDFRCPLYTTVGPELVNLTQFFQDHPEPTALALFMADKDVLTLEAKPVVEYFGTFGHMFASKLWSTIIYADRIAQRMPKATPVQLCMDLKIQVKANNPFLLMIRKLQIMHESEYIDLTDLIHLSYLTISPDGAKKIPADNMSLFSLAFWDTKNTQLHPHQIMPVNQHDWIAL